jgi:hypothetical protein
MGSNKRTKRIALDWDCPSLGRGGNSGLCYHRLPRRSDKSILTRPDIPVLSHTCRLQHCNGHHLRRSRLANDSLAQMEVESHAIPPPGA